MMIVKNKTYLNVPYEDREIAKKYGASFDKQEKAWFLKEGQDLKPLKSYLPEIKNTSSLGLDPKREFAKEIEKAGLILNGLPEMNGKIQRVPVLGDKRGKKSGAYKGFEDGIPAGFIQNHKTGAKFNWKATGIELTKLEAKEFHLASLNNKIKSEKEREESFEIAAKRMEEKWKQANEAKQHSYLNKKGVEAHGLKLSNQNDLLIPGRDVEGKLWIIQRVGDEKRYEAGGRKMGSFHTIGNLKESNTVIISEGYATAASIYQATGLTSVAAFDAANLKEVATSIKNKYPEIKILIAGDDDRHLPHLEKPLPNVGREKALEAARAVGGKAVFPAFGDNSQNSSDLTDFNDLQRVAGINAVKKQIVKEIKMELKEVHVEPSHKKEIESITKKFGNALEKSDLTSIEEVLKQAKKVLEKELGSKSIFESQQVLGESAGKPDKSYIEKVENSLLAIGPAKKEEHKNLISYDVAVGAASLNVLISKDSTKIQEHEGKTSRVNKEVSNNIDSFNSSIKEAKSSLVNEKVSTLELKNTEKQSQIEEIAPKVKPHGVSKDDLQLYNLQTLNKLGDGLKKTPDEAHTVLKNTGISNTLSTLEASRLASQMYLDIDANKNKQSVKDFVKEIEGMSGKNLDAGALRSLSNQQLSDMKHVLKTAVEEPHAYKQSLLNGAQAVKNVQEKATNAGLEAGSVDTHSVRMQAHYKTMGEFYLRREQEMSTERVKKEQLLEKMQEQWKTRDKANAIRTWMDEVEAHTGKKGAVALDVLINKGELKQYERLLDTAIQQPKAYIKGYEDSQNPSQQALLKQEVRNTQKALGKGEIYEVSEVEIRLRANQKAVKEEKGKSLDFDNENREKQGVGKTITEVKTKHISIENKQQMGI